MSNFFNNPSLLHWLYDHIGDIVVAFITMVVTLKLAKSAEKSAEKSAQISEQMKEIEIRTESPVVILVSHYILAPNKLIGINRQFKAAIKNVGNSVAIGIEIKFIKSGQKFDCNFGSGGKIVILDKDTYFPYTKTSTGDLDGFWLYDHTKEPQTIAFPFDYSPDDSDIDCILSYKSILGHEMETRIKLKDANDEIIILDQKAIFNA